MIANDFLELHGGRDFGDDKAVIVRFAKINSIKVVVIASHKGRTVKDRVVCNFEYACSEDCRKVLYRMKLTEKFHLPAL